MLEPTTLAKGEPFAEFENLQDRMRSLFARLGNGGSALSINGEFGDWSPAVDVTEDDKEYTISADLPEVTKDQVHVTIDDGVLAISGERKHEKEEKKKKYHRIERSYGKYERRFRLPEDVETEKIGAEFKKGALTVHLPKGEKKKKKAHEQEIKVQ